MVYSYLDAQQQCKIVHRSKQVGFQTILYRQNKHNNLLPFPS